MQVSRHDQQSGKTNIEKGESKKGGLATVKNIPNIQHFGVHVPADEEIHKLACLLRIEVSRKSQTKFYLILTRF